MTHAVNRRDFLRLSGCFVLSAALPLKAGCGGSDGPPAGQFRFPQGLASGDPRSTSVVLWTRVESTAVAGDIELDVEIATDAAFSNVVAERTVTATAASDFTVRVLVTDLTPATGYHYRFTAGSDRIAGRTRTAPDRDAQVPVHFAWVSCQDYPAGNYGAYRQLLADDDALPEADKIQFVLHLGDFIYETRDSGFQTAIDANFQPIDIGRSIRQLPSGDDHARTLADYRTLYKTYLSDPDLQAARARFPFINTWDDHEFSNDSWQSMANYGDTSSTDEPSQQRKLAANQAWFEFIPAQLTGAEGVPGVANEAKDFASATVTDAAFTAPNAQNFVAEPNNAAAIGSLTIYRSLRFGKHVELVVTDQRSYRSDHAIPEEMTVGSTLFFDPRNVLPLEMVNTLDAGMTANGNSPPATVFGMANPRTTSPPGTMLGAAQKAWFKATMKGSDAVWKIWGNEVPLMRMRVTQGPVATLQTDRVLNGDAWDGYPGERNELMTYLRSEGIQNVVVVTGDIHAHFAGIVMDNYDAGSPMPVATELCAAGISSNSLFSFFESATRNPPNNIPPDVRAIVTFDASPSGSRFVENLNVLLARSTAAAAKYAETKDLQMGLAATGTLANAHLKYADTNAQGYGLATVTATQVIATLVTIERPITTGAPTVKRRARFVVPKDNPSGLDGPMFTGTPPVPY